MERVAHKSQSSEKLPGSILPFQMPSSSHAGNVAGAPWMGRPEGLTQGALCQFPKGAVPIRDYRKTRDLFPTPERPHTGTTRSPTPGRRFLPHFELDEGHARTPWRLAAAARFQLLLQGEAQGSLLLDASPVPRRPTYFRRSSLLNFPSIHALSNSASLQAGLGLPTGAGSDQSLYSKFNVLNSNIFAAFQASQQHGPTLFVLFLACSRRILSLLIYSAPSAEEVTYFAASANSMGITAW